MFHKADIKVEKYKYTLVGFLQNMIWVHKIVDGENYVKYEIASYINSARWNKDNWDTGCRSLT